jgi:molybdopterin-guanine dinucleotide biosynthesis protein A
MGADKGLLKLHANTWAQTAVDKISVLEFPVVISVNDSQYPAYTTIFPQQQLIKDNDQLEPQGPLGGVLSVHLQFPAEDLFILACDMPLMETEPLKELLTYYQQYPEPGAFVFTNDAEPEPLCGIYRSKALAYIHQLYLSGQLTRHSMKFMLDHINAHFTPLTNDQKKYFRNFNAHAELNGL